MTNDIFPSARSTLVADLLFAPVFAAGMTVALAFSTPGGWSAGLRTGLVMLVVGASIALARHWESTKRQPPLS